MLYPNLPTRRVYIVGDDSLFDQGLSCLLTFDNNLQISSADYNDDASLLDDLEKQKPDVIVLTESEFFDSSKHILELLFSTQSLTALYVVVIRLGNNLVDVYEMPKRFIITQRDELVAVVRGNFNHI